MGAIIFDGNEFAKKEERLLKKKVDFLLERGIMPKLVTILVGDDPASKLYVSLKKKAAERVGCILEVLRFEHNVHFNELVHRIRILDKDPSVHGVMVQLPLPESIRDQTERIIKAIDSTKDVDGLKEGSSFKPAVLRAVLSVLGNVVKRSLRARPYKVVVVGAKGAVGKRLVRELRSLRYKVSELDKEDKDLAIVTKKADAIISATGVPGIIRGNMVKKGAIVIDVGSPKGDVLFNEVAQKAAFITPVPGGVGPITVISLIENLVKAASLAK